MSILDTGGFGNVGQLELALDDFAERRELEHHRLQERRDRILGARRRLSGPDLAGAGVTSSTTSLNTLQGQVETTQTTTNLAVQGAGLLRRLQRRRRYLSDPQRLVRSRRVGQLVNSAGYYLMGAEYAMATATNVSVNSISRPAKVNVDGAADVGDGLDDGEHDRQSALDRDGRRGRQSAIDEFRGLDIHGRDHDDRL